MTALMMLLKEHSKIIVTVLLTTALMVFLLRSSDDELYRKFFNVAYTKQLCISALYGRLHEVEKVISELKESNKSSSYFAMKEVSDLGLVYLLLVIGNDEAKVITYISGLGVSTRYLEHSEAEQLLLGLATPDYRSAKDLYKERELSSTCNFFQVSDKGELHNFSLVNADLNDKGVGAKILGNVRGYLVSKFDYQNNDLKKAFMPREPNIELDEFEDKLKSDLFYELKRLRAK
ncbi:hypothetical protein [Pleionea sp. CnH1-48]|uniref:hypothetical protein n=1 Tax=Pleionea sp. CnH1-48 TaxID=2954494 RepID=UPI0020984E2C|nr:hypothetical protein [Pleionea sp. CnH1-48]MCO7224050.1 hypothetical protein [Pleionea sp. CnH1-48]